MVLKVVDDLSHVLFQEETCDLGRLVDELSVQGPRLASCSLDVVGDAEFCHRLSFGGSVTGRPL